jgi:hypothetical protein
LARSSLFGDYRRKVAILIELKESPCGWAVAPERIAFEDGLQEHPLREEASPPLWPAGAARNHPLQQASSRDSMSSARL